MLTSDTFLAALHAGPHKKCVLRTNTEQSNTKCIQTCTQDQYTHSSNFLKLSLTMSVFKLHEVKVRETSEPYVKNQSTIAANPSCVHDMENKSPLISYR